jgi:hypothetical protein
VRLSALTKQSGKAPAMQLVRQYVAVFLVLLIALAVPVLVAYTWFEYDNRVDRAELAIVGTMNGRLLTDEDIFREIETKLPEYRISEAYDALNRSIGDGRVKFEIRNCKDLAGYDHTCRFYDAAW